MTHHCMTPTHRPCLCRIKSLESEIEVLREAKSTIETHEDYPGEFSELVRISELEISAKQTLVTALRRKDDA